MRYYLLLGLLLGRFSFALAVDVTTCGQTVPDREIGVLQTDLVCPNPGTIDDCLSPTAPVAVNLAKRGSLDLNGHTITGGCYGVRTASDYHGRHTITGPGTITGAVIGVEFTGRLTISDVNVDDNWGGILSVKTSTNRSSRLIATNVSASGSTGPLSGEGFWAPKVVLENCTANGNVGVSISADLRLVGRGVSANDCGTGVISLGRLVLDGFTITNSTYSGIIAQRAANLKNGIVTGTGATVDVCFNQVPVTSNLTCGTSSLGCGAVVTPLGICTND
jgi:hypothetical protein